jgi:hypothetical protein
MKAPVFTSASVAGTTPNTWTLSVSFTVTSGPSPLLDDHRRAVNARAMHAKVSVRRGPGH